MVDFLILYEVKARELENICLIRAELERRGYSVELFNEMNVFGERRPRLQAKVILTSAMYADMHLRTWVYYTAGNVKKVVNLQWEQILTKEVDDDKNSMYSFQGTAKQAVHLCWGEKTRKKLLNCGISPKKAVITGPIQMDFLRKKFKSYYLSKEKLFEMYKLPMRNKTCLFISSFSYVNQFEPILDIERETMGGSFDAFLNISNKSYQILLEWIEKLLLDRSDINFIYRPHPAEAENSILHELAEKYENFFVIRDLSVKQWVLACDTILSWYSTTAAEIFFANKTFEILRPVNIPEELDVTLLKNAKMIKTYDEFIRAITVGNNCFPIKEEEIYENYDVDKNIASYLRICDLLEQILQTNDYDIEVDLNEVLLPFTFKDYIKYTFIYDVYLYIMRKIGTLVAEGKKLPLSQNMKKNVLLHNWHMKEKKKNIASPSEIEAIMIKLRSIVNEK